MRFVIPVYFTISCMIGRIYWKCHWFSDVIVGALYGWASAAIVHFLLMTIVGWRIEKRHFLTCFVWYIAVIRVMNKWIRERYPELAPQVRSCV